MPQIGPLEILVVSVIALIVFGPQRLPEIARSVGRALNEFKRQAGDIRAEFESGLEVEDEREVPGPIVHKGTTSEPSPVAKLPDAPSPGPKSEAGPANDPDPADPSPSAEEISVEEDPDAPPSPS